MRYQAAPQPVAKIFSCVGRPGWANPFNPQSSALPSCATARCLFERCRPGPIPLPKQPLYSSHTFANRRTRGGISRRFLGGTPGKAHRITANTPQRTPINARPGPTDTGPEPPRQALLVEQRRRVHRACRVGARRVEEARGRVTVQAAQLAAVVEAGAASADERGLGAAASSCRGV